MSIICQYHNGHTELQFIIVGGGDDGEHNGVGFVEILNIFMTLGAFSQNHNKSTEFTDLFSMKV